MHVVEIFLPLDRGNGSPVEIEVIEGIVKGLADRFGGATAFTRQPADGLWKRETTIERDRIIVVEVMLDELEASWWRTYRERLEQELGQEQIMIRATQTQTL